jgi:hypothetical protein
MSEALFYDPAVLKVIRAILVSKGIRAEQDLEEEELGHGFSVDAELCFVKA